MSRVPVRGFQTASKQAINWIGNVTVTDVVQMNNDPQWENALTSAAANVEAQVSFTAQQLNVAKYTNKVSVPKGRRC
jgi:hypothetical protein